MRRSGVRVSLIQSKLNGEIGSRGNISFDAATLLIVSLLRLGSIVSRAIAAELLTRNQLTAAPTMCFIVFVLTLFGSSSIRVTDKSR